MRAAFGFVELGQALTRVRYQEGNFFHTPDLRSWVGPPPTPRWVAGCTGPDAGGGRQSYAGLSATERGPGAQVGGGGDAAPTKHHAPICGIKTTAIRPHGGSRQPLGYADGVTDVKSPSRCPNGHPCCRALKLPTMPSLSMHTKHGVVRRCDDGARHDGAAPAARKRWPLTD